MVFRVSIKLSKGKWFASVVSYFLYNENTPKKTLAKILLLPLSDVD